MNECPKCNKGTINHQEYDEDEFQDYDVPVLNQNGNGIWDKKQAPAKDQHGKTIYKDGVIQMVQWEEPLLEKIFVLKATAHVKYDFCTNALCTHETRDRKIVRTFPH